MADLLTVRALVEAEETLDAAVNQIVSARVDVARYLDDDPPESGEEGPVLKMFRRIDAVGTEASELTTTLRKLIFDAGALAAELDRARGES